MDPRQPKTVCVMTQDGEVVTSPSVLSMLQMWSCVVKDRTRTPEYVDLRGLYTVTRRVVECLICLAETIMLDAGSDEDFIITNRHWHAAMDQLLIIHHGNSIFALKLQVSPGDEFFYVMCYMINVRMIKAIFDGLRTDVIIDGDIPMKFMVKHLIKHRAFAKAAMPRIVKEFKLLRDLHTKFLGPRIERYAQNHLVLYLRGLAAIVSNAMPLLERAAS